MTTLLIWSNPRPLDQSYSLRVAKAFMDRYQELCPREEIIELDVYKQPIPFLTGDVLECWDKLRGGAVFHDLSREAQGKLAALDSLVEQFIDADKYIFVTPMWNLSIPPMMKAYIDTICIAGKTFKYTAQGAVGLLEGKKAVHIQARGGIYSQGPMAEFEFGDGYLRSILNFMGVTDLESVIVEGMFQHPERAQDILQQAMQRAQQAAQRFALPDMPVRVPDYQQPVHPIH